MKFKKWNIGTPAERDVALLRSAGYSYLLSTVLAARGVTTAEAAAGVFGSTLHVGVDLLLSPGWHSFTICEVNAFGDLLPRVLHEGRGTHAEQLRALTTGRFPVSPPRSGPSPSASPVPAPHRPTLEHR